MLRPTHDDERDQSHHPRPRPTLMLGQRQPARRQQWPPTPEAGQRHRTAHGPPPGETNLDATAIARTPHRVQPTRRCGHLPRRILPSATAAPTVLADTSPGVRGPSRRPRPTWSRPLRNHAASFASHSPVFLKTFPPPPPRRGRDPIRDRPRNLDTTTSQRVGHHEECEGHYPRSRGGERDEGSAG